MSWKSNELDYCTRKVRSFALQQPEHYVQFRKYVRNIIDWGNDKRLKEIRRSLDDLFEEGRLKTAQAAKSRPPPIRYVKVFLGDHTCQYRDIICGRHHSPCSCETIYSVQFSGVDSSTTSHSLLTSTYQSESAGPSRRRRSATSTSTSLKGKERASTTDVDITDWHPDPDIQRMKKWHTHLGIWVYWDDEQKLQVY